jgi:uncharacterized protein (TIGR03435 family)
MADFAARRRITCVVVSAWFAAAACMACSQQNPLGLCAEDASAGAKVPKFEVAAIKPGKVQRPFIVGLSNFPGGRIVITNFTLRDLVMVACDVAPFQFSGGPDWIDTERYVIEAKASDTPLSVASQPADPKTPLSTEQRQMLLALLIERFQLKFHSEAKEGSIYLLERGGGRLNLQPPKDPVSHPWATVYRGMSGIVGGNISMPEFAKRLSGFFQRQVIDKTGIAGSFDFDSKVGETEDAANMTQEDATALLISAIHGLGLKVTPAKDPVEMIVIDHAEPPSPN